jgi:hypothetical protein
MSIMYRVAAKFAMDARSDPRRTAVAYGRCARNSLGKISFPSSFSQGRVVSEYEVSVKANMSIANVMPQLQRRRANWPFLETPRSILAQPLGALALRAADCVARFAKVANATRYRLAAACGSSRQPAPPASEGYAPQCWGCTILCTSRLAVPLRHVTAQQPIAGARAGRPSRAKCYAPPCPACNPAKPSARSCWTYSEVP